MFPERISYSDFAHAIQDMACSQVVVARMEDGGFQITTPFSFSDKEPYTVVINRDAHGNLRFTDLGRTLRRLEGEATTDDELSRLDAVRSTLMLHGQYYEGGEIVVSVHKVAETGRLLFKFLQVLAFCDGFCRTATEPDPCEDDDERDG